jgi:catechol 2,3-dioxygenase-like lactoylglutathione lyase family enzyme
VADSVGGGDKLMPIARFQHINTRSIDVERTRDFYVRILGLRVGDRPPFESTGYWLYLGDQPVVHLVQRKPGDAAQDGAGNLDHVAFAAVDADATRAALKDAGIPFREAIVPRDGTLQIFVLDPDGIKIELNFAAP